MIIPKDDDNDDFLDLLFKCPITDQDIDGLISIHFGVFIKIRWVTEDENLGSYIDFTVVDDAISLDEFIETKLNPGQQEKVRNYICRELEKLNNRFMPSQVKSARNV